jgi:site-specific DNA recombinase
MRVPAGDIEGLVLDRLRTLFSSRTEIGDALAPLDLEAHALDAALCNASALSDRWLMVAPVEMRSLIREIIEQITVAADRIEIRLNRAKIAAALQAGVRSEPDLDLVILSIEAKLRRAGKGKRLVIANGAEAEVNEGLVDLIKEAFAIRNQLLSGSDVGCGAFRPDFEEGLGGQAEEIALFHPVLRQVSAQPQEPRGR